MSGCNSEKLQMLLWIILQFTLAYKLDAVALSVKYTFK